MPVKTACENNRLRVTVLTSSVLNSFSRLSFVMFLIARISYLRDLLSLLRHFLLSRISKLDLESLTLVTFSAVCPRKTK